MDNLQDTLDTSVQDKSLVISQLKLVRDVQEHIKGYLFYDKEQVFLRNEKKKCLKELEYKTWDEISNHWIFETRSHQFQVIFCNCGDYFHSNHITSCVKCNYRV